MLFSQRELDVYSGEKCEDVGLQHGDEDLEDREREAEGEGTDAEQAEDACRCKEERGGREAQHQQHVAGNHVHQESDAERDRAQDERREELDRRDDDVQEDRHIRREQRALQEGSGGAS